MKFALCIGINKYPGTGADLRLCVADAHYAASVLKRRGFAAQTLLDAKRQEILNATGEFIARGKSGDTLVWTYSGHGSNTPDLDGDEVDGLDECICPGDIMRNGPITDDELFAIFVKRAPGVKLLMLSDSCHSGTMSRLLPAARSAARVRFLPPSIFAGAGMVARAASALRRRILSFGSLALALSRNRIKFPGLLISGCLDHEYSYEGSFLGRDGGSFTTAWAKALFQIPATATHTRWYREIRKLLPTQTYPQTPNLYGTSAQKAWRLP